MSGCHDSIIHHSKPASVSLECRKCTPRPCGRFRDLLKSTPRATHNLHLRRGKSKSASDDIHYRRKICTSLFSNCTIAVIKLPRDILKPSSANLIDVGVNLHNLLVVASAELRTVYTDHPTIVICDALKCKSGIALLTLCTIAVPGGTGRPLDVNNVHRTAAPGKANFIIALHRPTQFGNVSRQKIYSSFISTIASRKSMKNKCVSDALMWHIDRN